MAIPKTIVHPAIYSRTGQWRNTAYHLWGFYPHGRVTRACSLLWSSANHQWMARIMHWDRFEYLEEYDEDKPPFEWAENMVNLSMEHIYADNT